MKDNKYLHYTSMVVILGGSLILFYLTFLWYVKENIIMGTGMLIMGLIALSNFYLHWRNMRKK